MTKSLPKGWRYDRLKDVAAINRRSLGASTDPNIEVDYLEISNVNVLGIVDRSEIEHLRFADAPSRARRCVSEGATIISSVRPNLQAVAFIDAMDSGLICSTGFNVVEPIRHKLAPRYLYYYLLSDDAKQYFVATAKGVGYPAIDDKEFSTVDVPLPSLPEQKRIAAFLDAKCADIDKAIEVKRKQLDCIDEMWKNILYKATTQGLGAARMVKTRNRLFPEIPNEWRLLKIARCFDTIGSGTTPKSHNQDYYDGETPWLQSGDLHGRYVDITAKCVSELALKECNLTIFKAPFIAIAMYGASIANTSIVRIDACTNQACCTLNEPRWNVCQAFVYYSLCACKDAMLMEAHGGTQPNISREIIRKIKIPLPPYSEQCEIANYLDAKRKKLDELTDNLRRQIEVLSDYRKSLIHECVMGERRVG